MSNVSFEVHCASNSSNIIAKYNIISSKIEFSEKIMLKQLLAKSNPLKLISLKCDYNRVILFIDSNCKSKWLILCVDYNKELIW